MESIKQQTISCFHRAVHFENISQKYILMKNVMLSVQTIANNDILVHHEEESYISVWASTLAGLKISNTISSHGVGCNKLLIIAVGRLIVDPLSSTLCPLMRTVMEMIEGEMYLDWFHGNSMIILKVQDENVVKLFRLDNGYHNSNQV